MATGKTPALYGAQTPTVVPSDLPTETARTATQDAVASELEKRNAKQRKGPRSAKKQKET